MATIFTLNARDTMVFDLSLDIDGMTYSKLGPHTRKLHKTAIRQLDDGDVKYADLRTALVPGTAKSELALIFDTTGTESNFYGWDVAAQLLPLLGRTWNGSILAGDLIHPDQGVAQELLRRSLNGTLRNTIRDTMQYYAVYLTNLTQAQRDAIVTGLGKYGPYVGSIDATYESSMKVWLSFILCNVYVKNQDTFISSHPDDIEHVSDENSPGWPLEDHGYRVISVPGGLAFDSFLSYKIERPVLRSGSDTLHGLATISGEVNDLSSFCVVIEPAKLKYLQEEKRGSLDRADLSTVTSKELVRTIESRLQRSYIYELDYLADYSLSKFNIVIQVEGKDRLKPVKLVVALEYKSADRELRLITMF